MSICKTHRPWVILLIASPWLMPACAEPSEIDDAPKKETRAAELLSTGLLPSPSEQHLKEEYVLAEELAATIERLEGVLDARVHLSLAGSSPLLQKQVKTSRAAVVVQYGKSGTLDEKKIREIALAAVDGLQPENVAVFPVLISKPERKTVFIGPIEVAESSALTAKIFAVGLLVVCLVSAIALVWAGLKIRSLKSRS